MKPEYSCKDSTYQQTKKTFAGLAGGMSPGFLADESFIPRWTKSQPTTQMCIVSGCSYLSFTLLQKATTEQLQHALTKLGLALERGCTLPAPLCKGHYHAVYNVIYPTHRATALHVECPSATLTPNCAQTQQQSNNTWQKRMGSKAH